MARMPDQYEHEQEARDRLARIERKRQEKETFAQRALSRGCVSLEFASFLFEELEKKAEKGHFHGPGTT